MSVPRTRRYPRRPITNARWAWRNVSWETLPRTLPEPAPTPMMIATALAAHYGKRTAKAYSDARNAQLAQWVRNLTVVTGTVSAHVELIPIPEGAE